MVRTPCRLCLRSSCSLPRKVRLIHLGPQSSVAARAPTTTRKDLDKLLDTVGKASAASTRSHMQKVNMLKRPAAASEATCKRPAASEAVCKRPAAASSSLVETDVMKRPSAGGKGPEAESSDDEPLVHPKENQCEEEPNILEVSDTEIEVTPQMHAAAIRKCTSIVKDKLSPPKLPGKLCAGWQRGEYRASVKTNDKKETIISVTDTQLGCSNMALAAGKLLLELYDYGVSIEDLKRCKEQGGLFDTKILPTRARTTSRKRQVS